MNMGLYEPFNTSTKEVLKKMASIDIEALDIMEVETDEISSMGISSIITFVGKIKGRLLMDMEPDLALYITNTILDEKHTNLRDKVVLSIISEINNIISGNAITLINNKFSMNLIQSPPIVFVGNDMVISIPKVKSMSTWGYTEQGRIRINVTWEQTDN